MAQSPCGNTQLARKFSGKTKNARSPQPGPAATLAFDDLVALLEQALALAILALLLLLDVGALFIGHGMLPAVIDAHPTKAAFSSISKANSLSGIKDVRTGMITRRNLVLSGLGGLLGAALARADAAQPSSGDPVAIINAIYTRAAKGKGDGGGTFVIENKAAKAKYLSKSLIELWAKADAHTPKDDVPPIDFDPVTNSQEPDVKSFKVMTEKLEADKAVIAVTITGRLLRFKVSDNTVRYNFVREDGKWKIDDISGTIDGEAWSIRNILSESLKEVV
jgi:hypothetical protein